MINLVTVVNNQAVVGSRQVAEHFEKRHSNVLRAIDNILSNLSKIEYIPLEDNPTNWFCKTTYMDNQNRIYPEYFMNRSGFELLAGSFTGEKGLLWLVRYLQSFKRAEKMLEKNNEVA